MSIDHIKGVVSFKGGTFFFGVQKGYGIVQHNGRTVVISFNCQSQTMPPQGDGSEVRNASGLRIDEELGLMFSNEPVVLPLQME